MTVWPCSSSDEQEVAIEHLEKTNHELRTKLAELDTIRVDVRVSRRRSHAPLAICRRRWRASRRSSRSTECRDAGRRRNRRENWQVRLSAGRKPGQFVVHMALLRSGVRQCGDGHVGPHRRWRRRRTIDAPLDLPALTSGKLHELPSTFAFIRTSTRRSRSSGLQA